MHGAAPLMSGPGSGAGVVIGLDGVVDEGIAVGVWLDDGSAAGVTDEGLATGADEAAVVEDKARRRGLVVDDETLHAFYDARVPREVTTAAHFDRWWRDARAKDPGLLDFDPEQLLDADRADYDESAFPRTWVLGEGEDALRLDLTYEFAPKAPGSSGADTADGVFVQVPIVFLNQLSPEPFEWMIPGLRTELITALIRSMPKAVRKSFVPAPDVAAQAAARLEEEFDPAHDALLPSLELALRRIKGVVVPPDSWDWAKVPEHLRVTFQVRDPRNRLLGEWAAGLLGL